jgi:hypothetical protein
MHSLGPVLGRNHDIHLVDSIVKAYVLLLLSDNESRNTFTVFVFVNRNKEMEEMQRVSQLN